MMSARSTGPSRRMTRYSSSIRESLAVDVGGTELDGRVERNVRGLPSPAPQPGHRRIDGDSVDPCESGRLIPARRKGPPQLIDRFLNELLALGRVRCVHPRDPFDGAAVLVQ